jgi:hypothetical protein
VSDQSFLARDPAFPSSTTPSVPVTEEEVRYAVDLRARLVADPVVEHWLRAEAEQRREIRTPLDVIGLQRAYLAGLTTGVIRPELITTVGAREPQRSWWMSATVVLERAVPFLWLPEMYGLATESGLPEHTIAPFRLPQDPMAWWFSHPAKARPEPARPDGLVYGLLITAIDDDRRLMVVELGAPEGAAPDEPLTYRFDIRAGQRFGTDFVAGSREAEILQMLSFLQSRYIALERQRPRPDQMKRLRRRAGRPVDVPDVMVIKLRAPEPATPAPDDDRVPRRWHHRWMVRGHHRAQWYPSLAAHRVIWVAPHFKGPADAPLVPQVYAVVR